MEDSISSKTLNVNSASIIDLKAELYRKKDQFKKEKLQNTSEYSRARSQPKKPTLWSKKNAGVLERNQRDLESKKEEEDELDRARSALKAKAKLYDNMTRENYVPDEESGERFLVDFEKKAIDKVFEKIEKEREEDDQKSWEMVSPGDEWVDYTDSLGRSRKCMKKDLAHLQELDNNLKGKREGPVTSDMPDLLSEDMRRELVRQKWEAEEAEALDQPIGPIHYSNVQHKEKRTHGVGFYQFAKDETERKAQMQTLDELRDKTLDQRSKRDKLKAKRKAIMDARLAKVKQRRNIKEVTTETTETTEDIGPKLEEQFEEMSDAELRRVEEDKKKAGPVREWDKGKAKEMTWKRKVEEIRDERPQEFAPPTLYFETSMIPAKSTRKVERPNPHHGLAPNTEPVAMNSQYGSSDNKNFSYLSNAKLLPAVGVSSVSATETHLKPDIVQNDICSIPLPENTPPGACYDSFRSEQQMASDTTDVTNTSLLEKEEFIQKADQLGHAENRQESCISQHWRQSRDVPEHVITQSDKVVHAGDHHFVQPQEMVPVPSQCTQEVVPAPSQCTQEVVPAPSQCTQEVVPAPSQCTQSFSADPVPYDASLQKSRNSCSIEQNEDAEFYQYGQEDVHISGDTVSIDGVRFPMCLPLPPTHNHLPPEQLPSLSDQVVELRKQGPKETHIRLEASRIAQLGVANPELYKSKTIPDFTKSIDSKTGEGSYDFKHTPRSLPDERPFVAPSVGRKVQHLEQDKKDYAYKVKFTSDSIGDALKFFRGKADNAPGKQKK